MLIQFEKTSGRATGDYQPGRSHMREGASRNPAIQLRAVPPRLLVPVAPSRVEENDGASFLSSRDHGDAEFRDSVVFYVIGILFLTPLILAGIAVKFG
jgi:hypothetical protein